MAEDSDLERTEPASQKRLDDAREKGQVPRSPELSTFAVLLAGGGAMVGLGSGLMQGLERMMTATLTLDRAVAFRPELMLERFQAAAIEMFITFAPYLGIVTLAALAAPMLVSGWLFTFEAVAPQF